MISVSSTKMKAPWYQGLSLLITVSPRSQHFVRPTRWVLNHYIHSTAYSMSQPYHIQNWNVCHPPKYCSTCRAAMLHNSKECHPNNTYVNGALPPPQCAPNVDCQYGWWLSSEVVHYSSPVDGNAIRPVAQAKNFGSIFDSSLTFTPHIHSLRKWYWLCLQVYQHFLYSPLLPL